MYALCICTIACVHALIMFMHVWLWGESTSVIATSVYIVIFLNVCHAKLWQQNARQVASAKAQNKKKSFFRKSDMTSIDPTNCYQIVTIVLGCHDTSLWMPIYLHATDVWQIITTALQYQDQKCLDYERRQTCSKTKLNFEKHLASNNISGVPPVWCMQTKCVYASQGLPQSSIHLHRNTHQYTNMNTTFTSHSLHTHMIMCAPVQFSIYPLFYQFVSMCKCVNVCVCVCVCNCV